MTEPLGLKVGAKLELLWHEDLQWYRVLLVEIVKTISASVTRFNLEVRLEFVDFRTSDTICTTNATLTNKNFGTVWRWCERPFPELKPVKEAKPETGSTPPKRKKPKPQSVKADQKEPKKDRKKKIKKKKKKKKQSQTTATTTKPDKAERKQKRKQQEAEQRLKEKLKHKKNKKNKKKRKRTRRRRRRMAHARGPFHNCVL